MPELKTTAEQPECLSCGGKQSKNPHPDAGNPRKLLEVGAVNVCIPCMAKSRHDWSQRALSAERQVDSLTRERAAARDAVREVREAAADFMRFGKRHAGKCRYDREHERPGDHSSYTCGQCDDLYEKRKARLAAALAAETEEQPEPA